jgi:hypothetical protein
MTNHEEVGLVMFNVKDLVYILAKSPAAVKRLLDCSRIAWDRHGRPPEKVVFLGSLLQYLERLKRPLFGERRRLKDSIGDQVLPTELANHPLLSLPIEQAARVKPEFADSIPKGFCRPRDAALYAEVDVSTIRQWCKEAKIRSTVVMGRRFIAQDDLAQFKAQRIALKLHRCRGKKPPTDPV